MLLPCEDNLLRNITLDRAAVRVGRFDSLPGDIERALMDVFESEISLQRRLDILKRDLEIRYDYSTLAAYRSIDKYNDGRVDSFNLGSFLRSCGHYASEHELLQIIRRIDTDGDGKLNYAEFSNFIRSAYPAATQSFAEPTRTSSPLKSSQGLRSSSPTRSSPVRASPTKSYHSPVRCNPVRHTHHSPVRCSPVKCPCSLCSLYPCSCCTSCSLYPCRCPSSCCVSCSLYPCRCPSSCCSTCHKYSCCCPVRSSPSKKPILHLHEED